MMTENEDNREDIIRNGMSRRKWMRMKSKYDKDKEKEEEDNDWDEKDD